ncbi:hypothetical protein RhiTH_008506 [Rhizoctonia solani]
MIDIESVTQYGRVRIAGGGDRFRVAKSDSNPWDRDNTFVRMPTLALEIGQTDQFAK